MPDIYKALADPTRRTILDELVERDDQTLFEICSRLSNKHDLSMSRQAVSQHLEVLESAGLIRVRKEGRYKFHRIDPVPLRSMLHRWTKSQTTIDTTEHTITTEESS